MSIIIETALSTIFEKLFSYFDCPDFLNFARESEVLDEILRWKKKLPLIQAVVNDSEKHIKDQATKLWLAELRGVAEDVDEILNKFNTAAVEHKLVEKGQVYTGKKRKLMPDLPGIFRPRVNKFYSEIASQLKEITERLEDLEKQKGLLYLTINAGGKYKRKEEARLPTTSLVNERRVRGRDKDKKAILELLLNDDNYENGVSVIPIVGKGGVGKTTLSQLVYNDVNVDKYFDLKVWVCVSEDFDVITVTRTILQAISSKKCNDLDLNLLQVKLKEALADKKFLLVLDDIRNFSYNDWTVLKIPLEVGVSKSKIIVTTQDFTVSSAISNLQPYHLKASTASSR